MWRREDVIRQLRQLQVLAQPPQRDLTLNVLQQPHGQKGKGGPHNVEQRHGRKRRRGRERRILNPKIGCMMGALNSINENPTAET